MPHIAFALSEKCYWISALPGGWKGWTTCPHFSVFVWIIISPLTFSFPLNFSLSLSLFCRLEQIRFRTHCWFSSEVSYEHLFTSHPEQFTEHNCIPFLKLKFADIPFFCTEEKNKKLKWEQTVHEFSITRWLQLFCNTVVCGKFLRPSLYSANVSKKFLNIQI